MNWSWHWFFVAAIGLGPLPGILALTLHTAGVAGKLLSEAIETVDMKQVEAGRGYRFPPSPGYRLWLLATSGSCLLLQYSLPF
jgi:ABC-type arginine/histidine transport system permease subunit